VRGKHLLYLARLLDFDLFLLLVFLAVDLLLLLLVAFLTVGFASLLVVVIGPGGDSFDILV
jgi:hypothetical protein